MTYKLTDVTKERLTWTERRRIQLAQFLHNVADMWVAPDASKYRDKTYCPECGIGLMRVQDGVECPDRTCPVNYPHSRASEWSWENGEWVKE